MIQQLAHVIIISKQIRKEQWQKTKRKVVVVVEFKWLKEFNVYVYETIYVYVLYVNLTKTNMTLLIMKRRQEAMNQ